MTISNREWVDKALELLREGLAPYIEREFPSEKVRALPEKTRRRLSNVPNMVDKSVGDWDVAALLKLMTATWRDVFHATLGHKVRRLVSELIDWRNEWAHPHHTSFLDKDTDRMLDSAERLLRAVSATQQADEIDGIREEFRRLIDDVHTHRAKRKKDGSSNAESGDAKVDGERGGEVLDRSSHHLNGNIDMWQIYQDYTGLIGEVVEGKICQIRRHEVLVLHSRHETGICTELVLPRWEQLPRDWYREEKSLCAVVKEVQWDEDENFQVIVSRRDPVFLERLLELHLPAKYSVKRIAWEPGEGVIVALWSRFPSIDDIRYPVRVIPFYIMAESMPLKVVAQYGEGDGDILNNAIQYICQEVFEPISLIRYSSDSYRLIEQVFSPAKPIVAKIPGGEEPPQVEVVVKAEEIGQVVGRNGINIRLASRISGCQIDVRVS